VARCPTTLCIALKVRLPAALTAVLTSFVCRLTRLPQLHTFTCLSQDLQYCQSSCEDYCDRPDQTNGLSSTVISARWLRGEINRWSSSSLGWTSQTGAGASCLGTDGGNGRRQGVGVGVAGQGRQYSEGRGEGLVLTISNTLVVDAMYFLCLRYPCVTHLTRWIFTVHVGALYTIEKLRSNEGTVARLRQPDSTYHRLGPRPRTWKGLLPFLADILAAVAGTLKDRVPYIGDRRTQPRCGLRWSCS
jgi:hypothetical protein